MLVGLFRWTHLASGHRCVLGLVLNLLSLNINVGSWFLAVCLRKWILIARPDNKFLVAYVCHVRALD